MPRVRRPAPSAPTGSSGGRLDDETIGVWQRRVARQRGIRAPRTGAITFMQWCSTAREAEQAQAGRTQWAVRWARRAEDIECHYPDLPRSTPLPSRHPDGRYSVRGAAEHLGVSVAQVRGWIRRGLVETKQEDFEHYPKSLCSFQSG
jgi:hypothetical protein